MDKYIERFPDQLVEALQLTENFSLPLKRKFTRVIVSGMGGSAIGAALVKDILGNNRSFDFEINRTYTYPSYYGEDTLAIFSSYSGNTEETLSAFNKALNSRCVLVCITSGGELMQIANAQNIPLIKIPGGMPPRTCVGYSMVAILSTLQSSGSVSNSYRDELKIIANTLKKDCEKFKTKAISIAARLKSSIAVIYTSNSISSVALRWKQQMNENAKQHCFHGEIPEMNHNELVSYAVNNGSIMPVMLQLANVDERIKMRFEISTRLIQNQVNGIIQISASGETLLQQVMYLLHLGDWVSYYLAMRNNVDPMDITILDALKAELNKLLE